MYLPRGVEGTSDKTVEVEVAMIYLKFVGTPTSRGHVEFPTWKFSNVFFILPPTTSNTHRPTASICSDGLDALMTLLMQPHVHLHYPQSPSLNPLAAL
jgi:hypothetical protein